jgi:DNA (cytosine-5)-methyltransferase 1
MKSERLRLSKHDDHCTEETFGEWVANHTKDRLAVDLFTGAGGLSLGIHQAGWTIAAGVDFDDRALETHAHNFSGMSLKRDLGDPDVRDELVELLKAAKIDLVAGGPPCQPFSRAGRNKIADLVRNHGRDPEDHRKKLWQAYLDIVVRVRPRAVLMENVPDMGLSDDFAVVRVIEEKLESLGYATQVRIANAWQHGVPQHRRRLILLARNDVEQFEWPDVPDQITTLEDAIADLPQLPVQARTPIGDREWSYDEDAKKTAFAVTMRAGAMPGIVHDHTTRLVRKDDLEIFAMMNSRTLYSDLPEDLQRYSAENFTDKYKRLDWKELSRTITAHIAKDGYWYIHPEQHRTLTVREAARIQTFPDRFRFAGTRSDAFRQIGNAVPPVLGAAAASALAPVADDPKPSGLVPKWRAVRDALDVWAAKDSVGENWFLYPGPHITPLHAAVIALLTAARLKGDELNYLLGELKNRKRLTEGLLARLIRLAPTEPARKRLARLQPALGVPGIWSESRSAELVEIIKFKPSEEALVTFLLGNADMLLVSQGALRVGARVNGSKSDQINRETDGRVDLARLVGAGQKAAHRMAAIGVIGRELCGTDRPSCDTCPLMSACKYREELATADPKTSGEPVLF